jgi:alpha-galactosidase
VATAVAMSTATVITVSAAVTIATPSPAHALENGLARTPPMGFNNWNTTHCRADFNEAMVKGIADIFVNRGLKDLGYQYVNIDDCWALPRRNAQGDLVPDPKRFPNGIKAVADYVHSKGLKFGIYTSAGTKTCNDLGFPGGLDHEEQDAKLFASWGVDYLKYDNCNNQGRPAIPRYTKMRDALAKTGRPIVYSICEWGQNKPWTWAQDVGNLWRTTGDISDNWNSMIGKARANRVLAQYAKPGAWNDPDMLEVGNGGMSATEYRTHFSLWAIMAAPLLIGSDLRKVSEDTFTILKNADVIAVDQDKLGKQGTVISNSGGLVVYSKVLANGDRAVALSNENTSTATISTTTSAIGMGSGTFTLKDLWSKSTRTTTGAISASVPGHGTVMYRVSKDGGTPTNRIEAESATISQGVVESNHAGFSGTGFVNYTNVAGGYVEFTVSVAQAGSFNVTFGHANGTAVSRPMNIAVDGETRAGNLGFGPTGAWTNWSAVTVPLALTAGVHTIRATATTANGGPNLDYLDVSPVPAAAGIDRRTPF